MIVKKFRVTRNDFPSHRVDVKEGDLVYWKDGKNNINLFRASDNICILSLSPKQFKVEVGIVYSAEYLYSWPRIKQLILQ